MSFSFNFPTNRPMIQESQSMKNNGGGGNTGYFQRGKKKKDENENSPIFVDKDDVDTFVLEEKTSENLCSQKNNVLNSFINKAKKVIQQPKKVSNNPFNQEDEAV